MVKEDEEKREGEGKGAAPGGKPVKKLIVLLIAVAILGGGGFYAWNSGLLKESAKKKAIAARPPAEAKVEIGPTRPMETFIVNLADPSGRRYLKVKMDLELNHEKLTTEVDKRLPQLRDAILTTLCSKTFEDIAGQEGKMQLRAEMMAMINQYLTTGKITNIYFTEFIVQ